VTGLADKLEVATDAQAEGEDPAKALTIFDMRSEEHTSELQSLRHLVCRLPLEKKKNKMRRTPKLALCDPATLLGAMMLSAQTGLEPGGPLGQAFLIPRWNKHTKCTEAQFQIGYRGLVQLAARSGVSLVAHTVRNEDTFDWQYGTDEYLHHRPVIGSEQIAVAWYAVGKFADGRVPLFVVIDRNVTEAAKAAGSAGNKGPWASHYNAMAEKTAAIRLSKWLPLTTDVAYAVAADGAVVRGPDVTVEAAAEAVPEDEPEQIEAGEPEPENEPAEAASPAPEHGGTTNE